MRSFTETADFKFIPADTTDSAFFSNKAKLFEWGVEFRSQRLHLLLFKYFYNHTFSEILRECRSAHFWSLDPFFEKENIEVTS